MRQIFLLATLLLLSFPAHADMNDILEKIFGYQKSCNLLENTQPKFSLHPLDHFSSESRNDPFPVDIDFYRTLDAGIVPGEPNEWLEPSSSYIPHLEEVVWIRLALRQRILDLQKAVTGVDQLLEGLKNNVPQALGIAKLIERNAVAVELLNRGIRELNEDRREDLKALSLLNKQREVYLTQTPILKVKPELVQWVREVQDPEKYGCFWPQTQKRFVDYLSLITGRSQCDSFSPEKAEFSTYFNQKLLEILQVVSEERKTHRNWLQKFWDEGLTVDSRTQFRNYYENLLHQDDLLSELVLTTNPLVRRELNVDQTLVKADCRIRQRTINTEFSNSLKTAGLLAVMVAVPLVAQATPVLLADQTSLLGMGLSQEVALGVYQLGAVSTVLTEIGGAAWMGGDIASTWKRCNRLEALAVEASLAQSNSTVFIPQNLDAHSIVISEDALERASQTQEVLLKSSQCNDELAWKVGLSIVGSTLAARSLLGIASQWNKISFLYQEGKLVEDLATKVTRFFPEINPKELTKVAQGPQQLARIAEQNAAKQKAVAELMIQGQSYVEAVEQVERSILAELAAKAARGEMTTEDAFAYLIFKRSMLAQKVREGIAGQGAKFFEDGYPPELFQKAVKIVLRKNRSFFLWRWMKNIARHVKLLLAKDLSPLEQPKMLSLEELDDTIQVLSRLVYDEVSPASTETLFVGRLLKRFFTSPVNSIRRLPTAAKERLTQIYQRLISSYQRPDYISETMKEFGKDPRDLAMRAEMMEFGLSRVLYRIARTYDDILPFDPIIIDRAVFWTRTLLLDPLLETLKVAGEPAFYYILIKEGKKSNQARNDNLKEVVTLSGACMWEGESGINPQDAEHEKKIQAEALKQIPELQAKLNEIDDELKILELQTRPEGINLDNVMTERRLIWNQLQAWKKALKNSQYRAQPNPNCKKITDILEH